MSSGFPNYRPVPQYVVDELNLKKKAVYTSRLNSWIRLIGNSGNGLVLQSNPNLPIFGSESVYGNSEKPGAIGLDWEGNVVTVQEEDRGYRPSPIVEGLTLKDNQFGISRECSFTIKCFSKGQVGEIQKYFGEPGHTVLVEFGWDLERSLNQRVGLNTKEIADVGLDFGNILKKRRNSEGNYNALLGFIVGFKIASEGENFNCEVRIMGMGQMPATMQIHKPVSEKDKNTNQNSQQARVVQRSRGFGPGEFSKDLSAGVKNFRYMFNELPKHKQTGAIKALESHLGKEENYINFNNSTRNKLQYETDGGWWNNINAGGKRLSVPSGTKLVGNERFIKFETFKRILDTNDLIESEAGVDCGEGSLPTKIFTEFTICSAFDEMFSTNKDIMVIPNTKTPDFGFLSILSGEEVQTKANDCSQKDESGNTAVQFPERVDLGEREIEEGYKTIAKSGKNYGFFDNLYINFDYALDIISQENSTYRDVILGMANGMASAVCGMWQFQIVQARAPKTIKNLDGKVEIEAGKMCLQLVDMRCTSENKQSALEMVHNGEGSFFLSSQLDIDLPSDMMSSIISNRKEGDSGIEPPADIEGDKDERETNNAVFKSALEDKVLKTFNAKNAPPTNETETPPAAKKEKDEEQTVADMYNTFLEKIGCYPSRKDGKFNLDNAGRGEEVDAMDVLFFPTYDDELLFKQKRNENNPNYKPSSNEIKGTGPLMGMLKYNFEVHGNSGFNHGDTFGIIGIPEKYNRTGAFTITNVEHTITGMMWTTSIEGQFRPSK